MAPVLYMFHGSPPVRAVLITAKVVGVPLNIHELKYIAGDLFKPEYLKLNPQHTVPTLDDNGNIICDSHAINVYLVEKYGQDDSLYPKDLYKRAVVDQRLHFDSGVLFPIFNSIIKPVFGQEWKKIPAAKMEEIKEAYGFLESFLGKLRWVAGDCVTIADFSCFTSVASIDVMVPIDPATYPNITNWIKTMQNLPYLVSDQEEQQMFQKLFQRLLSLKS